MSIMDWQFLFPAGLGAAITGAANYFITRKKVQRETEGEELDNVEKAVAIWRNLAQDLNIEIGNLRDEITKLRNENMELRKMLEEMKRQFHSED